jgi:hypothetical protein
MPNKAVMYATCLGAQTKGMLKALKYRATR